MKTCLQQSQDNIIDPMCGVGTVLYEMKNYVRVSSYKTIIH